MGESRRTSRPDDVVEPPGASPAETMDVGRPVATRDPYPATRSTLPARRPSGPGTPTASGPPAADPDGTAPTVDPDGVAPDPGDVAAADRADARRTRRARALRVAGVVVLLVVVTGLALRDGEPVPARTAPVADRGPRELDGVPATAIADRWDLRLDPSRSLVGLAVLDRHVMVAHVARPGLRRRDVLTVTAHDSLDGRPLWSRDVADASSAVVVASSSGQVLLPTAESDVATGPLDPIGDRGRLVALGARDGTVAWVVPLTGHEVVRDHPERASVVVRGPGGVTEYDVASGTLLHDFPVPDGGEPGPRSAHLVDGTWVVPVADGWQLVDDQGATSPMLAGPDLVPVLAGDLAITADGRRVTARRRDGSTVWSTTMSDRVVDLRPPAPEVLAVAGSGGTPAQGAARGGAPGTGQGAGSAVVAVTVAAPADDFDRTTHLLDARGDDLAAVATGVGALDPDHVVGVEVGGEARLLCLAAPDWIHDPEPELPGPCPDRLGLLDADGRVLAQRGDVDLAVATWPIEPVLTRFGPILQERGRLRLYRWGDLLPTWSIPLDVVDPQPVLVATSTRGVVVGSNFPLPATVTWHG